MWGESPVATLTIAGTLPDGTVIRVKAPKRGGRGRRGTSTALSTDAVSPGASKLDAYDIKEFPMTSHTSSLAFSAARDFLLANRTDYDTAVRDFRWPELGEFNWALDHFDV